MSFLIDHQIALILGAFATGVLGAWLLYRRNSSALSWRIADIVWVVLGGLGAIMAVLTGLYESDRTRIARQIDVAFVASKAFDRDAARFRLLYCGAGDAAPAPPVATLCGKVEFLSASTARNAALPLFIEIARIEAPLRSLTFLFGAPEGREKMQAMAEAFDPGAFLAFASEDAATAEAMTALATLPEGPRIVAEFRVLAQAYEDLIGEVRTLREEWMVLQQGSLVLVLQVVALCMIAFAAPFRIGKSVNELLL